MQLKSVKIYGFGILTDRAFDLSKNSGNIMLENEMERETFRDFLLSMFYGLYSETGKLRRKKYYGGNIISPDLKNTAFGGEVVFELDGRTYQETCIWGQNAKEDSQTLRDFNSGRVFRTDRFCGIFYQLTKIPEKSFSAVFMADNNISSFFDNKEAVIGELSKEKNNIKAPNLKSGILSGLVMTKMNSKNDLARLSEGDKKIKKEAAELELLKKKKLELKIKISENERILRLSKAARSLLLKDKINSEREICNSITAEKEFLTKEAEKKSFSTAKLTVWLVVLVVTALLSGGLIYLGITSKALKLLFFVAGAVLTIAFIVELIIFLKSFLGRDKAVYGGSEVIISKRLGEIEKQLTESRQKINELTEGAPFETLEADWRFAESELKGSDDRERRSAVLRRESEILTVIDGLNKEKEPLSQRTAELEANINEYCRGKANLYSEITAQIKGIDDQIRQYSDEYEALVLVIDLLEDAFSEYNAGAGGLLTKYATEFYFKLTGRDIKVKISDTFDAVFSENNIIANIALRAAVLKIFSGDEGLPVIIWKSIIGESELDLTGIVEKLGMQIIIV